MNKVAIVTGATGGIGEAIVRQLVMHGYHCVCPVRDAVKGENLVKSITQQTKKNTLEYKLCDLAVPSDIKNFCDWFISTSRPCNVLVNNAALVPNKRETTPSGIEMQWAVNVLSYYYMTEYLLPIIIQSAPSRIVNVASNYASGLDLTDPEFKKRDYDSHDAYKQSKQANRMMAAYYADQLKDKGVIVTSCHPGVVDTAVLAGLQFRGRQVCILL